MVAYDLDQLILILIFYKMGSLDSYIKGNTKIMLKNYYEIVKHTFEALRDLHSVGIGTFEFQN